MGGEQERPVRVCLIGTAPPRRCGIATFTGDLRTALTARRPDVPASIVALSKVDATLDHGDEVVFEIHDDQRSDYRAAAEFVNLAGYDVVNLQHEFGIFGGPDGRHVIELLDRLRVPVVTTLHTVEPDPDPGRRDTLRAIAERSHRLIVLADRAVPMLRDVYGIDPAGVAVVPHGVPDVPFLDAEYFKPGLFADGRAEGRRVLLTFGLISPDKGIEVVLDALPEVVADHPELLYVVLGATHPEVRRTAGESYRESLLERVAALGLEGHVAFDDRYLDLDDLVRALGAADLYVTPYHSRTQIVSGTLAYAFGLGRGVISTPYPYATELLADGRGRLFPHGDSGALASVLGELLEDDVARARMRRRAYDAARAMTWPAVADATARLLADAVTTHERRPAATAAPSAAGAPLPEPSLRHLERLTDDTGILQHAPFGVADRAHGYATDDVARALVVVATAAGRVPGDAPVRLAATYLSFMRAAARPDGSFENLLTYERAWVPGSASQDTLGQAVWGLGATVASSLPEGMRAAANELLTAALPAAAELTSPRGIAYAVSGLHGYLERYPGARAARRALAALASRLEADVLEHRSAGWEWFEPVLAYGNARLPHALLLAGKASDDAGWLRLGLRTLDFLLAQTYAGGAFDFVGNEGWHRSGRERAAFGQQPIEAGYTAEACMVAYEVSGDVRYLRLARAAAEWLVGRNRQGAVLYDAATGACADGLDRTGPSLHAGAESTIVALLGLLAVPAHAPLDEVGTEASSHERSALRPPSAAGGTSAGSAV